MAVDVPRVSLVGAGPGDPDLITLKGLAAVENADVLIYDRLVHPGLVERAIRAHERIYVGKQPGVKCLTQESINQLMIDRARAGNHVVRLKGGDPFVFGRGGEEVLALVRAGIAFSVIPGVSAAVAVPLAAGIPVTHRRMASSFGVVSGHQCVSATQIDWVALSRLPTLVVLMGLSTVHHWSTRLCDAGMDSATPVAVISHGTMADQQVVWGTLRNIARRVEEAALSPPATAVVGEVVLVGEQLKRLTTCLTNNEGTEDQDHAAFQDVA